MARRGATDVAGLVERARAADPRAVARLISLVENDAPALREIAELLTPFTGRAHVVGLTGSPGVGKSTSTSVLIGRLRESGLRVGVLAIDPTSPFSGGALLGDRVRMSEHATDPGVFIRSMATRGHLGGLAAAAPQALRVLDAVGCDLVLLETVGVGQSEIEIVRLADTTMVLLAPGMGDGIQAAKAGILEIADVFVINKADRDGANQVARELRMMQSYSAAGAWTPPIVQTVASRGEGADAVLEALHAHRDWLSDSGELARRRQARATAEVEALALAAVRRRFGEIGGTAGLAELAGRVAAGKLDPYAAAEELVASLPQQ